VWNTHKLTIIAILLITFIFLTSFSVLDQSAFKASLAEGAVFSTADWFTEIFVSFIEGEDVASIIGLMTIGALVLIVAKARGSAGFSVAGFMLVIFLPIFSVFDKVFTGINEIQFIAPVLYEIFVNPALCLFIYVILMLVFYFLLCSIILLFISMMPRSPFGGDD
jgi:hypothetical protein